MSVTALVINKIGGRPIYGNLKIRHFKKKFSKIVLHNQIISAMSKWQGSGLFSFSITVLPIFKFTLGENMSAWKITNTTENKKHLKKFISFFCEWLKLM